MSTHDIEKKIRVWPFMITFTTWKRWSTFVDERLDDLVRNAGTTFINVSGRMDKMQEEISSLKKEIELIKSAR